MNKKTNWTPEAKKAAREKMAEIWRNRRKRYGYPLMKEKNDNISKDFETSIEKENTPELQKLEKLIQIQNKEDQNTLKMLTGSKPLEEKYETRNKDGAIKDDTMKPRMSLVPQLAKLMAAKIMTYGAYKYDEYNWMKGFNWTLLADACDRHLTAFLCGEDIDEETGESHLAHLVCSAMMLLENTMLHPDKDDRWKGWKEEKYKNLFKQNKMVKKREQNGRKEKNSLSKNQSGNKKQKVCISSAKVKKRRKSK